MSMKNYFVNFFKSCLYCSVLEDYIRTIFITLKHFVNFFKMSLGNFNAIDCFRLELVVVHEFYPIPPGGVCQVVFWVQNQTQIQNAVKMFDIPMENVWLPLITGLTTGGLSCFAVQGGLLTSALANEGTGDIKYQKEKSILMFLSAKLIAYTLLGLILGTLGSAVVISPKFQGWLQVIVGLYMVATALRLMDIHPIFRHLVIQPPKQVLKLLRKSSQSQSFFTPALLGFLTVLIPCGVTQAMMLLAIASGSALLGAGIMFFFVLGTSPVFFLIGLAATSLLKNKAFAVIASVFILVLGILSLNSGQILRGSVHNLQNYWKVVTSSGENGVISNNVTIDVFSNGYKSSADTLKVGVPVKLTLRTNGVKSCARAFTIPTLNISRILPETGTVTLEFTPTKTGLLTYTCSMGMYSGSFNVIK